MIALLSLVPLPAEAGAWNRPKHGFYLKTGYNYLRAQELATPAADVVAIPPFTKNEATLYFEYGLSSRLSVILDSIAYRQSSIEGFESAAGIGDTRLGLQWQLPGSGRFVFAVRATLQFPVGDETKGESLLPTGSGIYEGEVVLGTGVSLWSGRGWAQAGIGPLSRGGGLRDGFVYDAQLGRRLVGRVLLMINVRGVQPWDTAPGSASTGSAAGFGDGVTYVAYGPSLIIELARGVALQLDVDGATNVRNIAKGPTYRVGLSVSR